MTENYDFYNDFSEINEDAEELMIKELMAKRKKKILWISIPLITLFIIFITITLIALFYPGSIPPEVIEQYPNF